MGPLNADVDDLEWIQVEEASAVGSVRRTTSSVATRLGFGAQRVAEVAIASSELATNAHVHGIASSVLVRARHAGRASTVELIGIDTGPGDDHIQAAFEDGVSRRGTLGLGLGSVRRLANRFDVHSVRGKGTVLAAVFARELSDVVQVPAVDGLTRPIRGEQVCGDGWASIHEDGRIALIVADGLGHGPHAAQASEAVIAEFARDPWRAPGEVLAAAHRRAAGTRGAAVSVLRIDLATRRLRFAGIGNVAARVVGMDTTSGLVPQPGIVGQQMRTVREVEATVGPGCLVVVHSDGLTAKWDLSRIDGATRQAPDVIAGLLLREASRPDDATVVVARVPA